MPLRHETAGLLQLDLLVGRGVYDRDGRKIAAVSEVRLARRGDVYVVEALHVGVLAFISALRALGSIFGFESWRPEVRIVRWEQVARMEKRRIHLRAVKVELELADPDA